MYFLDNNTNECPYLHHRAGTLISTGLRLGRNACTLMPTSMLIHTITHAHSCQQAFLFTPSRMLTNANKHAQLLIHTIPHAHPYHANAVFFQLSRILGVCFPLIGRSLPLQSGIYLRVWAFVSKTDKDLGFKVPQNPSAMRQICFPRSEV